MLLHSVAARRKRNLLVSHYQASVRLDSARVRLRSESQALAHFTPTSTGSVHARR